MHKNGEKNYLKRLRKIHLKYIRSNDLCLTLKPQVNRMCALWWRIFSAGREMEQVSQLLLFGSYNLANGAVSRVVPTELFFADRFPYEVTIDWLKEMAADSETPKLPQKMQPLLCFLVHVDYVISENEFRVYNCTQVLTTFRGVGWGVEGKQVGSMDEEPQVRGCYNITFICTPTNQETV